MRISNALRVAFLASFLLVPSGFTSAQNPSPERASVLNLLALKLSPPIFSHVNIPGLPAGAAIDLSRAGFLSGDDFFIAFAPDRNFNPSLIPSADPILLGGLVISGTDVWKTAGGNPISIGSHGLVARGEEFFLVGERGSVPVAVNVEVPVVAFDQPVVDFSSNTRIELMTTGSPAERTEIEMCLRVDRRNLCVKFIVSKESNAKNARQHSSKKLRGQVCMLPFGPESLA
jgi:hypothetical protein